MEEQFILRVPPSVAERIERLLNEEESSSEDTSVDLCFSEDGRTGAFVIGNNCFTARPTDFPTVMESHKTYDDTNLIKTADIDDNGQRSWQSSTRGSGIQTRSDSSYEFVRRVEKDLVNIMAGGTVENIDVQMVPQADDGRKNTNKPRKRAAATPPAKSVPQEPKNDAVDGERSDSDESEESD